MSRCAKSKSPSPSLSKVRVSGSRQLGQCDQLCPSCGEWCRWPKGHVGKHHICFQCKVDLDPFTGDSQTKRCGQHCTQCSDVQCILVSHHKGNRHLCGDCFEDFSGAPSNLFAPTEDDCRSEPESDPGTPDADLGTPLACSIRVPRSPGSSSSRSPRSSVLHTPRRDGVRQLTRRSSESAAGTRPSPVSVGELARQSSTRIEAVERLLLNVLRASDNTEHRLSQLRSIQQTAEAHVAQLTGRLAHQAAMLENCMRGGDSTMSRRLELLSSRSSKSRALSAGPIVRYR